METPLRAVKTGIRERSVSIIGASIAGLYAARELARRGVGVEVWEARSSLEPNPRTLIVTPAWLRMLDFDPEPAVLNRIHAFELVSQGASVRIPLREPDLVVERSRFVRLLAAEARHAGGQLTLGRRVRKVASNGRGGRVEFSDGDVELLRNTRRIVGADGLDSVLAEGVGKDPLRRVAIVQARVPLPSDVASDTVRVWFDRSSTRFFYWLIPESSAEGVAGVIHETCSEATEALERFLAARDLPVGEYQLAEVPVRPKRLWMGSNGTHGELMRIGDAAGQVKMTTVGGVVTGMRGAQAAVRSLVSGTSYRGELRSLRRKMDAHAVTRRLLDRFTDEDYDELLQRLNHRALRVLGGCSRDEMMGLCWRLLVAQPRWASLALRVLVSGASRPGTR